MSPVLKKNKWIAYGTETNWGGGNAGAAKAKTAWADGQTTACNIMRGCLWGFAQYKFEEEFDIGAGGLQPTAIPCTGADYKNPEWKDILSQTSALLVAVSTAAGATPGTIGANNMAAGKQSWTIVGSNGLADIQSFGCVPLKYSIVLEKNKPVLENCEWYHYDSSTGAIALTAVPFASTAVLMSKACTISVNGTTTYQVERCGVTFQFEYAEDDTDVGAYLRDTPVFVRVKPEWSLRFRDSTLAAVLDGDLKTSTLVETHDLILTLPWAGGSKTFTLNNWRVDNDGFNDLESDDAETKVFEATFKASTGFTQAVT